MRLRHARPPRRHFPAGIRHCGGFRGRRLAHLESQRSRSAHRHGRLRADPRRHALCRTVHEPQCGVPAARIVPYESFRGPAASRPGQACGQRQGRPDRAGHHRRGAVGNLLRAHHQPDRHRCCDHRRLHTRIAHPECTLRSDAGHRAPHSRRRTTKVVRVGGARHRSGTPQGIRRSRRRNA